MYVYVCVFSRVCLYAHVDAHVYMYTHVGIHACTCVCMVMKVFFGRLLCKDCMYVYRYMLTFKLFVHVYLHAYVQVHAYAYQGHPLGYMQPGSATL